MWGQPPTAVRGAKLRLGSFELSVYLLIRAWQGWRPPDSRKPALSEVEAAAIPT
jgi:hypothetical protein